MTKTTKHPVRVLRNRSSDGTANPTINSDSDKEPQVKRQRAKGSTSNQSLPAVPTSNGYETLTDDDYMSTSEDRMPPPKIAPKRKAPTSTTSTTNAPSIRPTTTAEKMTKPIIVSRSSFPIINNKLNTLTLIKKPVLQKMNNGDFKIFPYSAIDKKNIIDSLKLGEFQFFTYSEKEDRHDIYVLKNHHNINVETLLESLLANNILAERVDFLFNHDANPLYKVTFKKGTTNLNQLRYSHSIIDGLKITWDFLDSSKKRPSQCHRCQQLGHSAVNCNKTYRCVKCRISHPVGECARKSREEEGEPSCVNCGLEGHPANSPSCEYVKRYVERTKKASNGPRTFTSTPAPWLRPINNNNYPSPSNFPPLPQNLNQASFRRVDHVSRESHPVLNNPQTRQNSNPASQDLFAQLFELREDFAVIPGIQQAIQIISDLNQKLRSLSNPMDQARVLYKFLGSQP